jgi:hypothetical protein
MLISDKFAAGDLEALEPLMANHVHQGYVTTAELFKVDTHTHTHIHTHTHTHAGQEAGVPHQEHRIRLCDQLQSESRHIPRRGLEVKTQNPNPQFVVPIFLL